MFDEALLFSIISWFTVFCIFIIFEDFDMLDMDKFCLTTVIKFNVFFLISIGIFYSILPPKFASSSFLVMCIFSCISYTFGTYQVWSHHRIEQHKRKKFRRAKVLDTLRKTPGLFKSGPFDRN